MKSAFITGADEGIGLAAAKALGYLGYKVWIGARSEAWGLAAKAELVWEGYQAEFVQLDPDQEGSIEAAALTIARSTASLDMLINNASLQAQSNGLAIQMMSPEEITSIEAADDRAVGSRQAVSLTRMMLPLLNQAPSARILNISNALGAYGLNTQEGASILVRLATLPKEAPLAFNLDNAEHAGTC